MKTIAAIFLMFILASMSAYGSHDPIKWQGVDWSSTRGELQVDPVTNELMIYHLDLVPGEGYFGNALVDLPSNFVNSDVQQLNFSMDGNSDWTWSYSMDFKNDEGEDILNITPNPPEFTHMDLMIENTSYGSFTHDYSEMELTISRDEMRDLSVSVDGENILEQSVKIDRIAEFSILTWDGLSGGNARSLYNFSITPEPTAVPEPASWLTLGMALLSLLLIKIPHNISSSKT